MNRIKTIVISCVFAVSALNAGTIGSHYVGLSGFTTKDFSGVGFDLNWAAVDGILDIGFGMAYSKTDRYESYLENQKLAIVVSRLYQDLGKVTLFQEIGFGVSRQEYRWGSVRSMVFTGAFGLEIDITDAFSIKPSVNYTHLEKYSDGEVGLDVSFDYQFTELFATGISVVYLDNDGNGSAGIGASVRFHF